MADTQLDQFDDLFVISDLHLGGSDSPTLFDAGEKFTDWMTNCVLVQCRDQRSLGLVINGDMFDFLAEPGATYFNPQAAQSAVGRIAADNRYQPVFKSLKSFLNSNNAKTQLAITLGNHDLELCDKDVQRAVETSLGLKPQSQLPPEQQKLRWSLTADGYRCRVGKRVVLCQHGNAGDAWNRVDDRELQRTIELHANGRVEGHWIPNGGTQLVIDVLNPVREDWPFAQILKPEDLRLIVTLLCVDPTQRSRLRKAVKSWGTMRGGLAERVTSWFLAPPLRHRKNGRRVSQRMLAEELANATLGRGLFRNPHDPAQMLRIAHEQVELAWSQNERNQGRPGIVGSNVLSVDSHRGPHQPRLLDATDAAWAIAQGADRIEVLRQYLWRVKPDREFDVKNPTDTVYQYYREQKLPDVDWVVTGHTHYPRSDLPLPHSDKKARYFNAGTWARMMTIPQTVVRSRREFDILFNQLSERRNMRLFESRDFVGSPCNYVHFEADKELTRAELKQA